jgi:YfiR/HmsC-like
MKVALYRTDSSTGFGAGGRRINKLAALALLLAFGSGVLSGTAPAQTPNEYQVKAAFLFNFVKFIEWPAEAFGDDGAPLVIGVIGQDPFGSRLDQTVSGKSANGRQLLVRRFKRGEDVRACHVLFISSSEGMHLSQIIASLRGAAVLTVGDMDQFIERGGDINFITEANKMRFEINAAVAMQAHLKISSKLLALAKAVRT